MSYGSGEVVHLGWDWFNAAPRGTQDGGWLNVLGRAVTEVSNNTVPAPGTLALLGLGLAGLGLGRRRSA